VIASLGFTSREPRRLDEHLAPDPNPVVESNNWYWSGHNAAGSTTAAWGINFDDGFTGANTATDSSAWNYFTTVWARCVR
jgi:hypothetical protein